MCIFFVLRCQEAAATAALLGVCYYYCVFFARWSTDSSTRSRTLLLIICFSVAICVNLFMPSTFVLCCCRQL